MLETLFEIQCFDDISTLIYRKTGNWHFTEQQFQILIDKGELDLILFYLKIRKCRVILMNHNIQNTIVYKYIKYGNKIYYGAEMLSYISKNSWNMNITS